jgi:hypothetical protein
MLMELSPNTAPELKAGPLHLFDQIRPLMKCRLNIGSEEIVLHAGILGAPKLELVAKSGPIYVRLTLKDLKIPYHAR